MSVFDGRVEGKSFVEIVGFAGSQVVMVIKLTDLGSDLPDLPPLQIVFLVKNLKGIGLKREYENEKMSTNWLH